MARRTVAAPRVPRAEWERRILASALETFGREGYSASVNRIIDDAGAPVGTFYRLFPDKETLFARLMADLHPAYLERVRAEAGEHGAASSSAVAPARVPSTGGGGCADAAARLHRTIAALVVVGAREFGSVARLYFTDVRGEGQAAAVARRVERDELALLIGPIHEGIAAGMFVCPEPEIAALAMLGMARRTVEAYVLGRRKPSLTSAAAQVATLAVGGLLGAREPGAAS
jgi:AcrR family transcriptional regulator